MENLSHSDQVVPQNILLKISWAPSIEMLSMKEKASILTNIYNYYLGKPLTPLSKAAGMLFSSMVEVFQYNNERYEKKVLINRENGRKGGSSAKKSERLPFGSKDNPVGAKDKGKGIDIEKDRTTGIEIDRNTEIDIVTGRIKETDPRFEKYYMGKFSKLLEHIPEHLDNSEQKKYVQTANSWNRKLGPEDFATLIFRSKSEQANLIISKRNLEPYLSNFDYLRYNMVGMLSILVK